MREGKQEEVNEGMQELLLLHSYSCNYVSLAFKNIY